MRKKTLLVLALTYTVTTALSHSMVHSKKDHGAMPMVHS
ncbi:copper-binding protein, partial [Vibrio cholerae]|nr:copper-binding protein [Vibrio cholerae]